MAATWLAKLAGFGLGETLEAAGNFGQKVEEIFTTSDREKLAADASMREDYKAETERVKVLQQNELAQVGVNVQEARHRSVFVAGWRPYCGWICGTAMGYHFLFYPLVGPFVEKFTGVALYDLQWQELATVLTGMLGTGAIRAYEKAKNVSTDAPVKVVGLERWRQKRAAKKLAKAA